MWILNVGDIKPSEYQIELFLDMAWNLEAVKQQGVVAHQRQFLEREFGLEVAAQLQPVMQEAYRLAYIRKPEFMGNTRTEEKDPKFKIISDLPWSEQEIKERLTAYKQLSDKVEQEWHTLSAQKKETYFQLAKYPVQAAAQMNSKLLTAQLARRGKVDWADSDRAYDSIVSLTKRYNTPKCCHSSHDRDNTVFLLAAVHVEQHFECTSCHTRFFVCKVIYQRVTP